LTGSYNVGATEATEASQASSTTTRSAVVETSTRARSRSKKGSVGGHVVRSETSATAWHAVVEAGTRANGIPDFGSNRGGAARANSIEHASTRSRVRPLLEFRLLVPFLGFWFNVLHTARALLQMQAAAGVFYQLIVGGTAGAGARSIQATAPNTLPQFGLNGLHISAIALRLEDAVAEWVGSCFNLRDAEWSPEAGIAIREDALKAGVFGIGTASDGVNALGQNALLWAVRVANGAWLGHVERNDARKSVLGRAAQDLTSARRGQARR